LTSSFGFFRIFFEERKVTLAGLKKAPVVYSGSGEILLSHFVGKEEGWN